MKPRPPPSKTGSLSKAHPSPLAGSRTQSLHKSKKRRGAFSDRATQRYGTLGVFLEDPEKAAERLRASSLHHHIEDLRRQAEKAAAVAKDAVMIEEKPVVSVNIGQETAHRTNKVGNNRVHKNDGLSPVFSARRKRALQKRQEERRNLLPWDEWIHGSHNQGSVFGSSDDVSTSSRAADSPKKPANHANHERNINLASAKAKLKGFARAIIQSSSNAKFYFAAGSKIMRLAREAEEEEERAASVLITEARAATAEDESDATDEAMVERWLAYVLLSTACIR